MRLGVGFILGVAVTGAVFAVMLLWGPLRSRMPLSQSYLDCVGQTVESLLGETLFERESHSVVRIGGGAREPSITLIESISDGALTQILELCRFSRCQVEATEVGVSLEYSGEQSFYDLEISRLTGQYSATWMLRNETHREVGTCRVVSTARF